MSKEIFAQVTDINGAQRIVLPDSLRALVKSAYPQKFVELVAIIEGTNRLAIPSYVYRGLKRPLYVPGESSANAEDIVALSCGITWIPGYNKETGDIDIFPSSDKVFFALVRPVQHDRFHGELCWWGYWPEDRNRRGAPVNHTERFTSQIWQPQHH